jgi:hypothetical protein
MAKHRKPCTPEIAMQKQEKAVQFAGSSPFEDFLTPQDLAKKLKVHPKTVQRMFIDEPGVLILGKESRRDGKRQYVTLRIPPSVALRVLQRKTR